MGCSPDLLAGMNSAETAGRGLLHGRGGSYADPVPRGWQRPDDTVGSPGQIGQWSLDMSHKRKHSDVRHPEIVSYLESLGAEAAASHPPIVLEQDGGHIRYWLEDGRVCSCEVGGPAGRRPMAFH